jgi:hypothetical protein
MAPYVYRRVVSAGYLQTRALEHQAVQEVERFHRHPRTRYYSSGQLSKQFLDGLDGRINVGDISGLF